MSVRGEASRGRRVRVRALQTSAILGAMLVAGPAFAQCSPDPTVANGITNCTGTDSDGLTISTGGSLVIVATDAVVRPGSATAAITNRATSTSLDIRGLVDGGAGKAGLFVTTGPAASVPCDPYAGATPFYCVPGTMVTSYPSVSTSITVAAGGTVTGAQGILIRRDAGNSNGSISASVYNRGTISATAGPAIVADRTGSGYLSVTNWGPGFIGGISGAVSSIYNAGTIDGGSNAAIAATGASSFAYSNISIENRGTIRSSGSNPTVSSTGSLFLTNVVGATIGGSATAIRAFDGLNLINQGTINGSVIATTTGGQGSTIDTRTGTIDGDLILGAGNDTLRARYDAASGRIGSITGTIDGGAGIDTVELGVDRDTSFRTIVLPTNFERFGLLLSDNATATLASDFTPGTSVRFGGAGTLVNLAALVTNGSAITSDFAIYNLTFDNRNTVVANLSGNADYAVSSPAMVINSGTITANGGSGVSVYSSLANSGTIVASGTGALIASGTLANSGTIRSTGGTGLTLSGFSASSANDGTIQGATTGLALSYGRLTNSGTITGGSAGVSMQGGTLVNAASGTITGGIVGGGSNVVILNAGRIVGAVNLASSYFYDSSSDIFVDDGGSVTGAVQLGGGDDQLIVDLDAPAGRALAGATGGVDAGAGWDTLRYRVRKDASATLALSNGFEALAYELSDGAALTLTAPNALTTTIGLAGNGSVELNGNLSIADRTIVNATVPTTDQLTGNGAGPDRALSIVNNGTLTLNTTAQNFSYGLAAIQAGTADVTNNGTISVINAAGLYYPASGISGGNRVANSGTIRLTGNGTAINGAQNVANSGTITDEAGSGTTAGNGGIAGFATLDNSGTIEFDGLAVDGGYYSLARITNSGTIASRKGSAVRLGSAASLINEAGGTVRGKTAIDLSGGGFVVNRGMIAGDVTASPFSYGSSIYLADGGTLAGNLTFGQANDLFIQTGDTTGVTGIVDGGAGTDIFGYSRSSNAIIALDERAGINFEADYAQALGTDTVLTLTAARAIANAVYVQGDGTILNDAQIEGAVSTYMPIYVPGFTQSGRLASFINRGSIGGGATGIFDSFTNTGRIGSSTLPGYGVQQSVYSGRLSFDNSGSIGSSNAYPTVYLTGSDLSGLSAINSGTVDGSLIINATFADQTEPALLSMINSGTISTDTGTALSIVAGGDSFPASSAAAAITLANSGTIRANGTSGTAVALYIPRGKASTFAIDNSGIIGATGDGETGAYLHYDYPFYTPVTYTSPSVGLSIRANTPVTGTVTNSGTIEATGQKAVAVMVSGTALDLANSGTIRGTDTTLAADDLLLEAISSTTLAGAVQMLGKSDDRIVNTGTVIGSIDLGAGDDAIENYGRIQGNVWLGAGDDSFLHAADAVLTGIVDAGLGTDSLIIDATRGGAVNGDQFINFERFSQIGNGAVAYSGTFNFDSIGLAGGTVTVAAGQTLSSTGPVTILGGEGAETVLNDGTIVGTVDLGAGNDRVVNNGRIAGTVLLGAGDDRFVEGPGSSVAGGIDGGAGNDLYTVMLAGDRSGIGQRTAFERLSVEGSGALNLTLDQNFQSIALLGTGLSLALNGFSAGTVMGSDGAESLRVDGDVAAALMGAGDDILALGASRAAGVYIGGAGNDQLRFTANAPVTLAGTASGFEQIALTGGTLIVTGTLGATGEAIGFGDGAQALIIARGGTLAGTIDLGAGNDSFRLAAGATLNGSVSGGAGTDILTLELAGDRMLGVTPFSGFEILGSEGTGTLTLTGTQAYDRIDAATDLAVATGASLRAAVVFGAGDNRFTIAGGFAGSVDGGSGSDSIIVSGGSSATPVAFTDVANVEALAMTGGFATVSGNAAFGTVDLSGGRLVGLAGSVIRASQIAVRPGATFGSAGIVNGNIAVAGTLSPGASPGTMTVNGNVALAGGSVSLFELTPTVSDKLVVNGAVSIASGATLKIVADGQIRPGTSFDLVVASGGIAGSYTTIDKAASLFGFVVQRADRIQLLGQFLNDPLFNPQVSRSVDYANAAILAQPQTSALFAALPSLLTANGASNAQAFARLTPEPYATATQLGIDQALTLVDAARGPGFGASDSDDVRAFTFGQGVGQWHRLADDAGAGTAAARTSGYGLFSGIGIGNRNWAIGGFVGYFDSRQRIDALAARNDTDGIVAGIHGRYAAGGLRLNASVLYDGGDARTSRALPNGQNASARYGLHSWVGDLSVGYAIPMTGDWAATPRVGVTYIRTVRDRVAETGSVFALDVARDKHVAGFVDAGFRLARAETSDAAFRPFVGFGIRAQVEGRTPHAVAGYASAPLILSAQGAQRASVVGTASAGFGYRLNDAVEFFTTLDAQSGTDDHRESASAGVRLRF